MYEFDANNVFEHNKYIYAYCNPIGFKDPSGKAPKKKYKVIVLYDKDNFGDRLIAKEIISYMDIRVGRKFQKMM